MTNKKDTPNHTQWHDPDAFSEGYFGASHPVTDAVGKPLTFLELTDEKCPVCTKTDPDLRLGIVREDERQADLMCARCGTVSYKFVKQVKRKK